MVEAVQAVWGEALEGRAHPPVALWGSESQRQQGHHFGRRAGLLARMGLVLVKRVDWQDWLAGVELGGESQMARRHWR